MGTRRTKSSVKTNSGENSQHTSPRNKPLRLITWIITRKDFKFEIEGPTRKELKKSPCFRTDQEFHNFSLTVGSIFIASEAATGHLVYIYIYIYIYIAGESADFVLTFKTGTLAPNGINERFPFLFSFHFLDVPLNICFIPFSYRFS